VIVGAAIVPSPPLLARELTGRTEALPDLRAACAVAVRRLLADPASGGPVSGDPARPASASSPLSAPAAADLVVVIGAGATTTAWDPGERLHVPAWGPLLAARDAPAAGGPATPGLPLAVGIGARLLDEAGYGGPRALRSVGSAASAADCLALGAAVAGLAPRVALLVVGDGTARRTPAAPGYFDERAAAFDASAEAAIGDGDMAALAGLDASLAAELMATGRAAWQVLAGAVGLDRRAPGEVLYADAPLGVSYLVAVLDVR
jgi:hypothetical protein